MKLSKSKKGFDLSLIELIQLVIFSMALVAFIFIGVNIYNSVTGANPDNIALGQFNRLIHDIKQGQITQTPVITEHDIKYILKLENKEQDKKTFVNICLFKIKDVKEIILDCQKILGNKTDSSIIDFSGSFNINILRENENKFNLDRPKEIKNIIKT